MFQLFSYISNKFNYLFFRCVYSEDIVTTLENKLINSINIDGSSNKELLSIDLYKPKQISCDINPLYYSLAHYEDFSSSEFSDFEQYTYDDIGSVILNQTIFGNPSFSNMDINSTDSIEPHILKSQSNSACNKPNVFTSKDSVLDEKCTVNFNIERSDIGNKIKVVNNVSCELQHDLIKNPDASEDINSVLNVELSIECNNSLESSKNVQNNVVNSSVIESDKNNTKDCKPNFSNVDNLSSKNSNKMKISFDGSKKDNMIQETDDDLDVVSPHNFETFTVIKKSNGAGDMFRKYNDIEDIPSKIDQDPLKSESNSFQTFTVINENIIIDDSNSGKDLIGNGDTFESETSNDFKTFTVVNGVNTSPFHGELCSSSNAMLSNSKVTINNNDIIDINVLSSKPKQTQFDTITLLPQSQTNNLKNKVIDVNDLPNTLKNDVTECNSSKSDKVSTKKENCGHNESYTQINFETEENINKELVNCSNNCDSHVSLEDWAISRNVKESIDLVPSKVDNVTTSVTISEDKSQSCNTLNYQHVEKLKSSGESDSTLSLHLEILENNKGMNSPDSLNDDEVFGQEEKPIVSNKLEFVPLKATPIKDNRSPRLSRKYMECSPVMSANAFIPEMEKSSNTEENRERKNSSTFFIDFNQGKPKNKPKRFENLTKSLDSSTIATNKEKIFSMFIDFNEDSESSESSSKGVKHRKPQTLTDRFVRMHSEETNVKSNDCEDTVTPPPSRMTSTVENSSVDISESCKKQSVFMFIENDSPTPVKRRSLPQSSRLKSQRNSWNVGSTDVPKTHHRTHSVNLSEDKSLDARMTQSHIETGSNEFSKPSNSFDNTQCKIQNKVNGAKDSEVSLTDSFVRLSDMDKAPSQETINSLNRNESKSESLRRDLKNTELGKCLKRLFPYLKSIEIERILLSKPPHSLDNKEEIKTGLGQDLLRMFLEEIGADTTIDVNGRRIKAHKCVLTSRCQYFAAMFSGGWVQSAGNVLYLKG